jgi:N-acetylmuramoyl-L-alanine amidase
VIGITRTLIFFAILMSGGVSAQLQLVVNGQPVEGLNTTLVPGTSYAPAQGYAEALGATFTFDATSKLASFTLAGKIARLVIYASPEEAAANATALRLDRQTQTSPGGIDVGGQIFVPVKPIAQAFLGQVAFLPEQNQVAVVLPRATITDAETSQRPTFERFTFDLTAPVPYTSFFNTPLNTLQVRFERTDLARARSFQGERYRRADLIPGAGHTDFRLQLSPDTDYRLYATPNPRGYRLTIDLFVKTAVDAPASNRLVVVIDPGHGGDDTGLVLTEFDAEGSLTLEFAKRLAAAFQTRGVDVTLTRQDNSNPPLESRSGRGVGADLFLSIHAAELPRGQYNIYYLDEAELIDDLDLALRENAETALESPATNQLRRQLLLKLIPDLTLGRRYAQGLSAELFQARGYRSNDPTGAPLYVLSGAAGRGLLMELSPGDLGDVDLAPILAATLLTVLERGGF